MTIGTATGTKKYEEFSSDERHILEHHLKINIEDASVIEFYYAIQCDLPEEDCPFRTPKKLPCTCARRGHVRLDSTIELKHPGANARLKCPADLSPCAS